MSRVRVLAAKAAPEKVDRENGILHGVAVISKGEALGHAMWLDDVFIEQVNAALNDEKKGVKMRYTHPGLCSDGLSKYLGRVQKSAVTDDRVLADAHLSQRIASTSPDGNLYEHALNFAEDAPEDFGMSIVYFPDWGAEQEFRGEHADEDGIFTSPDKENVKNYRHARLHALDAVDMVGDPAANDKGLFGRGNQLAAEAELFADYVFGTSDHPKGGTRECPTDTHPEGGIQNAPVLTMFGDMEIERVKEWIHNHLSRNGLTIITEEKEMSEKEKLEAEKAAQTKLEKLTADAIEKGEKDGSEAQVERFNALNAEWPDRPDFVNAQFAKGNDVEKAEGEFKSLRITELEAANAELKKGKVKPVEASEADNAKPVNYSASSDQAASINSPDELAAAAQELAEEKGITKRQALKRLTKGIKTRV